MNSIFKHIESNTLTPKALEELLEQFDINEKNSIGYTPLMFACKHEQLDAAKLLLEHGASLYVYDENLCDEDDEDLMDALNPQPLTIASEAGNINLVRILLEHNAQVDVVNEDALTPLMIACKNGNLELAQLLINHNADVNCTYEGGEHPENEQDDQVPLALTFAMRSGNHELIDLLLAHKASIHLSHETLAAAYNAQDIPLLRKLLKQKYTACSDTIAQAIKAIIQNDSNLNKYQTVLTVLDTLNVINTDLSISGGNADDKIETAIIELGATSKHRLEYLYMFNWSYGNAQLVLHWNDKEVISIETSFDSEKGTVSIHLFKELAAALGLETLSLHQFSTFLLYMLSRMVQSKKLSS